MGVVGEGGGREKMVQFRYWTAEGQKTSWLAEFRDLGKVGGRTLAGSGVVGLHLVGLGLRCPPQHSLAQSSG